jgi:hypothetical protein
MTADQPIPPEAMDRSVPVERRRKALTDWYEASAPHTHPALGHMHRHLGGGKPHDHKENR